MKLPAYPRTKSSRVEWLGDVPVHWEAQGVKFCYSIQLGKMLQPEPSSPNDGETPYLKSQHVQWEHVRVAELPTMWTNKKERWQYAVRDGDLLVCEGGDVGRAAVVRGAPDGTIIQNALHRVRPQGGNESSFLLYVLAHAASQGWFEIICNKSTIAHFTVDKFGALGVALPTPAEQRAIASFLDRATGRLDRLLAKKRELIERLKEKRTALISRTVTRGLNAATPLKPSGVDWLGDIPEHWEVAQLRRKAHILDCKHRTVPFIDDGIPLASIREVHGFEVDLSNAKQTSKDEYLTLIEGDRRPRLGDIIYSRNATVGDAALVTTKERFCMGQDVCLIRAPNHHAKFLLYLFRSPPLMEQVESLMIGSTFRRINVGQIHAFWICVPPLPEQAAIAAYLDVETAKLDALVGKVEEAVERLQEYRTALITAAVTGKIDVRGPVPAAE
jgi:type I restriction enzyme S subunit